MSSYVYTIGDIVGHYESVHSWDGEVTSGVIESITRTVMTGNLITDNGELIDTIVKGMGADTPKDVTSDVDKITELTIEVMTRLAPIAHITNDGSMDVSVTDGRVCVRFD